MRVAIEPSVVMTGPSKQFRIEIKKVLLELPPWRPISSRKLAALLEVSLQVLANWRVRGVGPPSLLLIKGRGNRVFYRISEVVSWASTFSGMPVAAWQVEAEWLSARDLTVHGEPSPEGTSWLISQLDHQMR